MRCRHSATAHNESHPLLATGCWQRQRQWPELGGPLVVGAGRQVESVDSPAVVVGCPARLAFISTPRSDRRAHPAAHTAHPALHTRAERGLLLVFVAVAEHVFLLHGCATQCGVHLCRRMHARQSAAAERVIGEGGAKHHHSSRSSQQQEHSRKGFIPMAYDRKPSRGS